MKKLEICLIVLLFVPLLMASSKEPISYNPDARINPYPAIGPAHVEDGRAFGDVLATIDLTSIGMPGDGYDNAGLSWDGQYLYLISMFDNLCYVIDPTGPSLYSSFPAASGLSWGLGHEQNLWMTEYYTLTAYEYTYGGVPTGNSFYCLQGGASWMGDCSEWWPDGEIWILAVGGDNAAYKFTVPAGAMVTSISDPTWAYISQRGFSYDPWNDKFFVGGWNSDMVWELNNDGTPTGRQFSSISIASLAYDWQSTIHPTPVLWLATNDAVNTLYMIDTDNPNPVTSLIWDFEDGWQGWTNTNGSTFPYAWGVQPASLHGATWTCPDAGDSSMWIDDDDAGSGYILNDTALSPVIAPSPSAQWLKWGIAFNFISSSELLEVGVKYFDGANWNVAPLASFNADISSRYDSVDISAYAGYPLLQIYFYYDDGGTWAWYGAFDNVEIEGTIPEHDVGAVSISEPVGTYFLNDVVTPTVQVQNFGDYEETFPVIFWMIYNATPVYADTVQVTLAAGATDDAVFSSYTFTQAGDYDCISWTELAGDEDPANDTAFAQATVYEGLIPYIIVDVDPTPLTGPWLETTFNSWGLTGVYTTNPAVIHAESLAIYETAWFCTGIYSNYYSYTVEEANAIGTYLGTGRRAYFEGGDAWGFVSARTVLCPLFGIDPNTTQDGSADLFTVQGMANGQIPWVDGQSWTYTGENNWIDRLGLYTTPPNGGTVEGFLWNPSVSYWTGAAYDQGSWKTVASSHELAGDQQDDSLLYYIAMYLDLPIGINEEPGYEAPYSFGFAPNMSTMSKGHMPISYSTTAPGHVSLRIYDGIGRLVQTLVDAHQPAGEKSLVWDSRDANNRAVANGVYFLKLEAENTSDTHKLILVR